ncbi:AAA family ATPase, partial [Pseudidiomarina aestuarii]
GGMPEAVSEWFRLKDESILTRIEAVSQIHANLIEGYQRDFGKYSGQIDAQLIEAVFNAIPAQLASVVDESVKRFRFKDVYGKKSRYADFENAIAWLHRCRLTLLNYPIEGRPQAPLAAYKKDNRVKLYLFDTGLLNHMLGSSYREIKNQAYDYKGYIAENFVQQEFAVGGLEPSFGWSDARAEIEFIVSDDSGQIIPVEVKSGTRTRAKSLLSYKQRYSPERTIKLSATQGSALVEKHNIVRPLYYVETIFDLLSESSKL